MRARFWHWTVKGRNAPLFERTVYLLSWLLINLVFGQTSHAQIPAFEWAIEAGSRWNDGGDAIALDQSGNCYVTGSFTGVANFSGTNLTSFGGTDMFLAKYNAVGALQWVHKAGGSDDDAGRGVAV